MTTLGPQQSGHVAPFFLPDGRRFLFKALGAPDAQGIYLGSLDASTPTRLTAAPEMSLAFKIIYLPGGPGNASGGDGWLLSERAGTLVAQRLDLDRQTLAGDPVRVADDVVSASVAATRLIAYRTGAGSQRQMTWVDRSGAPRGVGGDSDATFNLPRVSPDGRRVALGRSVQGNRDVWLMDGAEGAPADEATDEHSRTGARLPTCYGNATS